MRSCFPIFDHHPGLVWLDNAATTHKPRSVIEAETAFYERQNANVHRATHPLGAESTRLFEAARARIAGFLGAKSPAEIVFTSGTTAGINLVAHGFAQKMVHPNLEILVTAMEHHANLVPWQQACAATGARLRVVPVLPDGSLDMISLQKMLSPQVGLLAVAHVSNVLGTVNPVGEICSTAQRHGVPVLVDAAQSIVCEDINVANWGADFLVFSGHKMFGPTGTGVLFAKNDWLERLPVWQTGGEMLRQASFEQTVFAPPPQKFEAGTPNVAGVIGLAAAVDFIESVGKQVFKKHAHDLLGLASDLLADLPGLQIVGTAQGKSAIISFNVGGVHPHDVATVLAERNICVRAGLHCAQPLHDSLGLPGGTVRVSFSIYNTPEDVARLGEGLREVMEIFGVTPGL